MIKNSTWTIGKRLWLLSGALMVVVTGTAGTALWNSSALVATLGDVGGVQLPAVRSMTLVDMMHDGIRANVLSAILASKSVDPKEVKEIETELQEFTKEINDRINEISNLNLAPATHEAVQRSLPEIAAYIQAASDLVKVALRGETEQAIAMRPKFDEAFTSLEAKLEVLGELIEKDSHKSIEYGNTIAGRAEVVNWSILVTGLVFGIAFSWLIVRRLQKSLQAVISELARESKSVNGTAQSLSDSANSLSEASAQQATAIQETAASVDEITAMVKKTSENCGQLETSAQASHLSASRGSEAISEMLRSIDTISESNAKVMAQVDESNRRIADIVKVIGEIGTKTKVINDIVFQTKLLSFNASVEAARAGEHGKGFAVVAEEVGNLAQMSGNAAKEISDMLDASILRVEGIATETKTRVESLIQDGKTKLLQGKQIAGQCETALNDIVRQSSDVTAMITEITTAVREQNQGIQEISKALSLLDQATNQNATTSRNTSETSEGLLSQARTLRSIVLTLEGMASVASETADVTMIPVEGEEVEESHDTSNAA